MTIDEALELVANVEAEGGCIIAYDTAFVGLSDRFMNNPLSPQSRQGRCWVGSPNGGHIAYRHINEPDACGYIETDLTFRGTFGQFGHDWALAVVLDGNIPETRLSPGQRHYFTQMLPQRAGVRCVIVDP